MQDYFTKMFAIGIGYYVLRISFRQKIITTNLLTKIVSIYFLFSFLLLLFLKNFCIFLFGLSLFLTFELFFIFLFVKSLENQFRSYFPDILTSIILQLKMGASFRKSLQSYTQNSAMKYREVIQLIFDHVVFKPQEIDKKMTAENNFVHEVLQEFQKIDQSNHKSVQKVENFRRRLIIINEFRRRSGKIRGQTQMQAILMSFLYGICFAAMFYLFPLSRYFLLILFSLSLFAAGLFGTFWVGRKIKWNL